MNNSIAKMSLGTSFAQNLRIMIPILAIPIVLGIPLCLVAPVKASANILAGTAIGVSFMVGLLWIELFMNKTGNLWGNKQPIASQPVVDESAAEVVECEAQPQTVHPSPSLLPVEDPGVVLK